VIKEWTVRILVGFIGIIKFSIETVIHLSSGFFDKSPAAIISIPTTFVKDVYQEVSNLKDL
jgi:hypothetical protein